MGRPRKRETLMQTRHRLTATAVVLATISVTTACAQSLLTGTLTADNAFFAFLGPSPN